MKRNKKGFTLVELVIVIAVIAILAGVMIAVFSGVIKRANENAELQQVKNDELKQKAEDVLTKLDNANWFSWEDFENSLAAKLTEAYKKYGADGDKIADQVEKAVKKAIDEYAANSATSNTSLTETQVKVIVENALANAKLGGVTEEQVRTIVNTAVSGINTVSKADIQRIVDAATAKGLTAEQVSNIIGQSGLAKKSDTTALSEKVDSVISALNALTPVTKKDVEDTIIDLVPVTKTAADETEFETLVGRLNSGSTIIVGFDTTGKTLEIGEEAGDKTLIIKGVAIDNLKVTAPKATIYLIADGNKVLVEATAQNSFHVLGKVTNLEINKGRVVLESGASVTKLKAAPSTDAIVTVVLEQNSEITTELEAEYQDHGYTEGKRDYIVIENNGDVKITNLTVTQALAESKTTTTNVVIKNSDGSTGTKVEDVNVTESVGSFDITVDDTDAIANASTNSLDVALFAGGTGTKADPYLIATAKQMQNITVKFENDSNFYYYKVKEGVTEINCNNWSPIYMWGSFDGNNVKFVGLDNTLFGSLSDNQWSIPEGNVVLENFVISECNIVRSGWNSIVLRTAGVEKVTFKNIKVSGYVEGGPVSTFVCFGPGNYDDSWAHISHFTFENCETTATTVSTNETAIGFVAHAMATAGSTITLKNSFVKGMLSAPNKDNCKYVVGNWYNGTITDDNENATTYYSSSTNGWKYVLSGKQSTISVTPGTLPANIGDKFELTAAEGATKAVFSLVVSPNGKADDQHATEWGCMTATYLVEEINSLSNGKFISDKVKYYTVRVNDEDADETGTNGNYFDIVNDSFGHTVGANTTVRAVQYDANGNILEVKTYNFNDKTAIWNLYYGE